jgi:hypothetical protein
MAEQSILAPEAVMPDLQVINQTPWSYNETSYGSTSMEYSLEDLFPRSHQWKVALADVLETGLLPEEAEELEGGVYTYQAGKIYDRAGGITDVPKATVKIEEGSYLLLKLNYVTSIEETIESFEIITSTAILDGDFINIEYIPIAKIEPFVPIEVGQEGNPTIRQLLFEPVRLVKNNPQNNPHMWKVTSGITLTPEEEGDPTKQWNVLGGSVTVQETTVSVPDTIVDGSSEGYIVLKIERDHSSRAYEEDSAEIQWVATALISYYSVEYYILAQISGGNVKQHRFEEIISYELLLVDNGEFKLLPFSALTRNTYDLP